MKSKLNIQADEKLLIGKLSNSANNPNLGYMDVYFEVNDGIVSTVNASEFIDSEYIRKPQVFIRGGYESYEKEYGYNQLLLFKSSKNTVSTDKGACIFTCVYSDKGESQHFKIKKDCPFVAEISQVEFSLDDVKKIDGNHEINSLEVDKFDTPHFFQIDSNSKKILGPLVQGDKSKPYFHGPRNETHYEFWNSRKTSDYQSLISNYTGYEDHIAEVFINDDKRLFLINLEGYYLGSNNKPRNQDFETVDLIPESYLVNEFYKAAEKSPSIKPFQKGKVKEWLDNKTLKLEIPRKTRLFKILVGYEKSQIDIEGIFKSILDSDEAEPILKKFATEDEDKYLNRFREKENKKLEEIKEEIYNKRKEIEQQNNAVKNELSKNQKELTELNKNKATIQEEIDTKLKIALENIEQTDEYKQQVKESTKTLSEINKKVEDSISKYGHYSDLDTLNKKYNDLIEEVKFKEKRESELKEIISKLTDSAKSSSSDLAKAYLNHQIISDIQNHDHYKYLEPSKERVDDNKKSYYKVAKSKPEFMTDEHNENRKSVINLVTERLERMNRAVDKDKVEAALIAIMQNQFVVFVGLPGSGKTSFAIQIGCALGASKATLTIPVAKDWTRPKDLMGYYNPITKSYESGVNNFYPFYESLNSFPENETTNSFLILDEFNLSQPEFYLSNLIGLSDNSLDRKINLGHDLSVTIPETNHFICTANTDETVQSLSARMISRCAFIHFNELPELEQTTSDLIFPSNLTPILTGTDMVSLFRASESDIISDSLKNEIDQLISAFREPNEEYGNGISIAPRKYKQLLQFCQVMNSQENSQSKVLDFASTFFLLPLISGSGKPFKSRLENICTISEDLSLDELTKSVKKIILDGESNFDQYYFKMA